VPILLGWILFGVNYFLTLYKKVTNWPVYFWMWGVGIVFMIYHLSEAHFWIFSDIRSDFIKDMSIQWKSYGSFVGSWNMLIYGTAIYVMSKIKDDDSVGRGKISFFFFFLGLTNLMFGWAHHTYIIPSQPWIRIVAYAISMTEWIIFINIIYTWAKSLNTEKKKNNLMAYRFLIASEVWVFLNIILGLLMSIPTLNFYTHGTHVTVAHSMGTTIGINTTILLASISFMVSRLIRKNELSNQKTIMIGYYTFNIALFVFWITLIVGGIYKAIWMSDESNTVYSQFHEGANPIFWVFIISGILLFIGILLIVLPLIKSLFSALLKVAPLSSLNIKRGV
jgi:nitric oxide reductase subunit B